MTAATLREVRERAEKQRIVELLPTVTTRRELADALGYSLRMTRYKLARYGLSDRGASGYQRRRPGRPRASAADRRAAIREYAEFHARSLEAAARAERRQLRAAMRRAARWQKLADEHPGDALLIVADRVGRRTA